MSLYVFYGSVHCKLCERKFNCPKKCLDKHLFVWYNNKNEQMCESRKGGTVRGQNIYCDRSQIILRKC